MLELTYQSSPTWQRLGQILYFIIIFWLLRPIYRYLPFSISQAGGPCLLFVLVLIPHLSHHHLRHPLTGDRHCVPVYPLLPAARLQAMVAVS
jgi:hypothetical protein